MKTRFALGALVVALAVSLAGCSDSVAPTDSAAPAAPQGLALASAPGGPALSWAPNSEPDLAGYYVYRTRIDGTQQGTAEQMNGEAAGQSTYDLPADPGQWQYHVRAVDTKGNLSAASVPVAITMGNGGAETDQPVDESVLVNERPH